MRGRVVQMDPHTVSERSVGSGNGDRPSLGGVRRILIVAPQPFFEDRGTPIAVRQAAEALAELGFGVDLLTYPVGRDVALRGVRQFRLANPLRLTRVPIGLSWRKIAFDLQLLPELRSRLRAERYVAVHAVEEAAFPALWLCKPRRIPVVYDMQSSLPEQLAQRAVFRFAPVRSATVAAERWLFENAALVVSSAGLAHRVKAGAPATRHREWRFHARPPLAEATGQAAAMRASLGIPANAKVILYAGSFEEYQGLIHLLRAIPRVLAHAADARFVFIGGEGVDELGPAARAHTASGVLRVIARRPREEMPAYYAMADVLVSPRSYGDNTPLKVFDYLAAGRPIVATDIGAHRTHLSDGRGLLVAAQPEAIADAIVRVVHDVDLAREMAARAQAYATEHLGWEGFVRGVSEWYEHVLNPAHEPGPE